MPDPSLSPKLSAATEAAQLSGYSVSIEACTSPFFRDTTEVRVSASKFSAPELVPDGLLRRQPDDGDAILAEIEAKLAERRRRF